MEAAEIPAEQPDIVEESAEYEPESPVIESQETPVEEPKTHKIKIDGEYVDVSIKDLEAAYGLEKASRKRFEEAATLRKEVDSFIDNLQSGDFDSLKDIIPEDQLLDYAETLLRKKIEWEETPEETRARIIAEKERDQLKSQLDEYTKKEQQVIIQEVNEKAAQEIDDEISDVIEELQGEYGSIVKTPEFIQDIARVMLAQSESGTGRFDTKKAAKLALNNWKGKFGKYVSSISHNDLSKYLTKSQLKQLRKSGLDTALSQFPSSNTVGSKGSAPKKVDKTLDVSSFFEKLDEQLN